MLKHALWNCHKNIFTIFTVFVKNTPGIYYFWVFLFELHCQSNCRWSESEAKLSNQCFHHWWSRFYKYIKYPFLNKSKSKWSQTWQVMLTELLLQVKKTVLFQNERSGSLKNFVKFNTNSRYIIKLDRDKYSLFLCCGLWVCIYHKWAGRQSCSPTPELDLDPRWLWSGCTTPQTHGGFQGTRAALTQHKNTIISVLVRKKNPQQLIWNFSV